MLSWMFQHDYLDTYCFECLISMCFVFCIFTCSAQLSMFHMERRSRYTLIIIIIIIIIITIAGNIEVLLQLFCISVECCAQLFPRNSIQNLLQFLNSNEEIPQVNYLQIKKSLLSRWSGVAYGGQNKQANKPNQKSRTQQQQTRNAPTEVYSKVINTKHSYVHHTSEQQ